MSYDSKEDALEYNPPSSAEFVESFRSHLAHPNEQFAPMLEYENANTRE